MKYQIVKAGGSRPPQAGRTFRAAAVPALFALAGLAVVCAACAGPVLPDRYGIVLPALPEHWSAALGAPEWRLTWIGPEGRTETRVVPAGSAPPDLTVPPGRPGMALAWPAWPERDLPAGRMRPAGAIFPYDAAGDATGSAGKIRLSWEAGPEAWLFLLMAAQTAPAADSAADTANATAVIPAKNRAWNFNWPRFRELLASGDIPAAIRADPWRADWRSIAKKTLESGFDRRRIKVPDGLTPLSVVIPGPGPWFGTSPFAPAQAWTAGETVALEAGETAETLISPSGQIRYRAGVWMWIER
jgi:hypothetical protein